MSGGGSQTTTSSSTVPPQFLQAYQNTVNRATSVASTPFQSYGGNLVAGMSADQAGAQAEIRDNQNIAQPYIAGSEADIVASTTPLWSGVMQSGAGNNGISGYNPNFWSNTSQTGVAPGSGVAGYTPNFWGGTMQSGVSPSSGVAGYTPNYWGNTMQTGVSPSAGIGGYSKDFYANAPGVNASTIAQYENPYQSQVVGATEAQIANTDAQQMGQLGGNAAAAGAFGGDRMGVAQGILGGQQAVANNATLAGLNQANYSQALGEANQQQGTAISADEADQAQANAEFNAQQGTQLGAMESAQQTGNQQFDEQQQAQLGANEAATQVGNSEFNTQQAAQLGANEASQSTANSEFNTQQQAQIGANEANAWLYSQAGYANANLGNEANGLTLTDASALSQSGLTQQQQEQATLNTAYEQWQAKQAFPYQQTGWLSNITEGIGSNVGGSSTSTTSSNAAGGRIGRAAGGIIPAHYAFGGGTPVDNFANQFDPKAMPWAVNFWNNDTLANGVLGAVSKQYGLGLATGGRAGYDDGGSILSEVPNVSTSFIPSASGGGSGGVMGRGPPAPQSSPMQPGMFSNPATDISAAAGATSLYKNLGLGGMFGGSGAGAVGAGTEYAGAATGTAPLTAVSAAPLADIGTGAAGAAASGASAAGGAGFLGSLGSAVDAGAAGIGEAASAVGSGLAAGASAIGDGLAAGGSWLMSFLPALLALKDGGAVETPDPTYQGGIVLPFPQDRVRRASGGIVGNTMPMPYTQAPPMPMQATGTTGMPPLGGGIMAQPTAGQAATNMAVGAGMFERGGAVETRAFGGGIGGHGGGMDLSANPFSMMGAPDMHAASAGVTPFGMGAGAVPGGGGIAGARPFGLRTGGIVPQHFDTGGTAAANDDGGWGGAGASTSDSAWDAPAAAIAASSSTPSTSSGSSSWPSDSAGSSASTPSGGIMGAAGGFTPDKPNLWMPALAAVASAVVGKHANAGRNIAEGVLTGLSTYGQENTQYQAGREKAASLDQEAKKLADDAQFHRAEIAREQQATDQLGSYQQQEAQNSAARAAAEDSHYKAMEGLEGQRNGLEGQRIGSEASYQNQEIALRQQMASQMKVTQTGTDASGNPVMMDSRTGRWVDSAGNPYAGPVRPTVYQQDKLDLGARGQNLTHDEKQAALDQAWTLKTAGMNQADREGIRKAADTIYSGAMTNGHPMTPEAAVESAVQQHARIGSTPPLMSTTPPGQAGASQGAAPQAPAAPSVPQTGTVQGGYRFLGGDPSNKQNWQQVQ